MMRGYWGFPVRGPFGHHIGGIGVAGIVLMIILWIAVIAVIVIGIRALILHSRRNKAVPPGTAGMPAGSYPPGVVAGPARAAAPSLVAILEERYARGEINRDEFLQRKQDLGLAGPAIAPTAPPAPEAPTPSATPPSTS